MVKNLFIVVFLGIMSSGNAFADYDTSEPMLYPSSFPTADTLRKNEWMFVPYPWGWAAWGATKDLTLAWDYPATILGYPAGFVRWQVLPEPKATELSLELYGVSWGKNTFTQTRAKEYQIDYRGGQNWLHVNFSQKIAENFRIHTYFGYTYTSYYRLRPHDTNQFAESTLQNAYLPDYGIDFEWSINSWMKFQVNTVHGNTFLFLDQILDKDLVAYTLQFAPFSKNSVGILRRFRIELNALFARIPNAEYSYSLPLPLYPYAYWQWEG